MVERTVQPVPTQVNIYEAKTRFSRLVDEVEAGGEILIARNGRPVARLAPLQQQLEDREPGSLAGQIWMAPDVDEPGRQLV